MTRQRLVDSGAMTAKMDLRAQGRFCSISSSRNQTSGQPGRPARSGARAQVLAGVGARRSSSFAKK